MFICIILLFETMDTAIVVGQKAPRSFFQQSASVMIRWWPEVAVVLHCTEYCINGGLITPRRERHKLLWLFGVTSQSISPRSATLFLGEGLVKQILYSQQGSVNTFAGYSWTQTFGLSDIWNTLLKFSNSITHNGQNLRMSRPLYFEHGFSSAHCCRSYQD